MSTEENAIEKKKSVFSRLWNKVFSPKAPMPSRKALPFNRYDWIAMIGISVFYAFFAFSNLGIAVAPQTSQVISKNEPLVLTVPEEFRISKLEWYYEEVPNGTFKLEMKLRTDTEWIVVEECVNENISCCWNGYDLPARVQQIRITYETADVSVKEMVLFDIKGNILQPLEYNIYPQLFDEQNSVPNEIDHVSSFYYDEMIYGTTAFDFINGQEPGEKINPPLGKIFIAIGVLLFGYTPFGIRFVGALLGVLMLPILYLLTRNITRDRGVSAFVMFLFAFDFMHFTQTRVATIDVFVTFFVIIMFYFMERYLSLSFYEESLVKTWIPLGCCGIAFGLGIASKWTGFYAGAGLTILFLGRLIRYYREYRYAILVSGEMTNNISHKHVIAVYKSKVVKTIVFFVLFFLIIPFTIYVLSYIPFVDKDNVGLINKMIENQKFMFDYRGQADFYNEYTSQWYEWPFMIRPMSYYVSELGFITYQGINVFGNPLVWWAGIPAFIFTLYQAICKRKKEAIFLCIAYLVQYVPWMFVSIPTFIYNYFPCVPFVALMIGYCFWQIKHKVLDAKVLDEKSYYCLLIIYAAVAFALFQLFLPVISGEEVTITYVDNYLSWLKEWKFVK